MGGFLPKRHEWVKLGLSESTNFSLAERNWEPWNFKAEVSTFGSYSKFQNAGKSTFFLTIARIFFKCTGFVLRLQKLNSSND